MMGCRIFDDGMSERPPHTWSFLPNEEDDTPLEWGWTGVSRMLLAQHSACDGMDIII
jgi:hypothetical protein